MISFEAVAGNKGFIEQKYARVLLELICCFGMKTNPAEPGVEALVADTRPASVPAERTCMRQLAYHVRRFARHRGLVDAQL